MSPFRPGLWELSVTSWEFAYDAQTAGIVRSRRCDTWRYFEASSAWMKLRCPDKVAKARMPIKPAMGYPSLTM